MLVALLDYLSRSSFITIFVMSILSIYFITIFALLIYRYFSISSDITKEKSKLTSLRKTFDRGLIDFNSNYEFCDCEINADNSTTELLNSYKTEYTKDATAHLTTMSIIASTSPFIGLFGTVVSILESFSKFGLETKVTLNVIAPAISEALIATAAGIFVATFAYSFHQMLKRKSYELVTIVDAQSDILIANANAKKEISQDTEE
jgi:biopolymer transport protein ExbB/TolQ